MNKTTIRNSLLLLLTATIWGFSFVAQSKGMEYVGPLTFNGVRAVLGGLVLVPFAAAQNASNKRKGIKPDRRALIMGGLWCGVVLFLASSFQQYGILYTSVGKSGFITAFYIVLVPIFGLALKRKTGALVWVSAMIALIGLYLLCINETFSVNLGDMLTLVCAVLFAVHILVIDHFAPKTDSVTLSMVQFFVNGVLGMAAAFLFEKPTLESLLSAWAPILYAGVMSCGVAYTLQIIGQKGMNPAVASLILSLESCIAVLAGWLFLNQNLSARELIGCGVMFTAIVLAQLPGKKKELEITA
ncbi:MAG TPA: DMT family transporter [Clostridia bacterium]|nr:DMT family transporter [Clostridia bacterium]